MFSGLVSSLDSAYSPQCDLSSEIPASLITLVDLFTRGVAFSVLFSGVVIAVALIAWSSYSEAAADEEGDRGVGGDSQESYAASGLTYLVNDGNYLFFLFWLRLVVRLCWDGRIRGMRM